MPSRHSPASFSPMTSRSYTSPVMPCRWVARTTSRRSMRASRARMACAGSSCRSMRCLPISRGSHARASSSLMHAAIIPSPRVLPPAARSHARLVVVAASRACMRVWDRSSSTRHSRETLRSTGGAATARSRVRSSITCRLRVPTCTRSCAACAPPFNRRRTRHRSPGRTRRSSMRWRSLAPVRHRRGARPMRPRMRP